jgi:hypothetical protein
MSSVFTGTLVIYVVILAIVSNIIELFCIVLYCIVLYVYNQSSHKVTTSITGIIQHTSIKTTDTIVDRPTYRQN